MTEAQTSNPTPRLIDIDMAIDGLGEAFCAAAHRAPDLVIEGHYRIAGYPVLVRVAGTQAAADVDKALCHLRATEEEAPELTIEIWSDDEVGPLGWAPWPEDADTNGTITISKNDRFILTQRPSSVMLLDRCESRIVGCLRGRDRIFQDERARPFHRLLSIWLNDRDIQFIHSGLVARGSEGLLLAGKSGSGKTSASIACYLGGLTFLSDDYVALQALDERTFVGHSLYATCLIDRIERFPSLVPFAHTPNYDFETKHSIYLTDHPGGSFASDIRLAAIILPNVVNKPHTTYRPAKPMEAMLSLAPSSIWILPGAAGLSLEKLSGLVTTVPSFWIELGWDGSQIAPTVERIWRELAE